MYLIKRGVKIVVVRFNEFIITLYFVIFPINLSENLYIFSKIASNDRYENFHNKMQGCAQSYVLKSISRFFSPTENCLLLTLKTTTHNTKTN